MRETLRAPKDVDCRTDKYPQSKEYSANNRIVHDDFLTEPKLADYA